MKTLVSAIALLVGSNVMAVAADQTLKFKLVTFYMGDKDGESHMVGVSVSPNGTIGTKDFYDKPGKNGASTGHSTYYFPDGSIVANYSNMSTGTATGGHVAGKYQIVSGTVPIRARPAEAQLTGTGATRAPSRMPVFLTLNWT